jgi:membrane protease YdiL (CAAX protease family)
MADESVREAIEERRAVWIEVAILTGLVALPIWFGDLTGVYYPSRSLFLDGIQRLVTYLPICVLVLYFMARSRCDWEWFGLGKNWDFLGLFSFAGGLVAAGMFSTWAIETLIQAIDPSRAPIQAEVFGAVPRSIPEWLTMWPVLLIAAAFEELVFRGFMTARIHDVTGKKWIAVLLPAVVFGSLHLYQGTFEAVGITVYGVVFGIMFLEWRRLKALILAHFAFNVWAFAYWVQ